MFIPGLVSLDRPPTKSLSHQDVALYGALLSSCERGSAWQAAAEVFEEMRRAKVQETGGLRSEFLSWGGVSLNMQYF